MIELTTTRRWLVFAGLAPGMFLAFADAMIIAIIVPQLVYSFNTSVPAVSWVMNGYNIVLTTLFLTLGRVSDRYGRKLFFVLGLTVFTAASLGCALSPTIGWLIAFRIVQATGAAAMIPASLAMLLGAHPQNRQGFAAGLFGVVSNLALAAGPALGGYLMAQQSWLWSAIHLRETWQLIFFINLPIGTLGILLAIVLLPGHSRGSARAGFDLTGVAFSSSGLFCLTLGLIQGNTWHWDSVRIIGLFVTAVLLLTAFVLWELRASDPLFDLRLFQRRAFAAAASAIMTVDIAFMGTAYMLVIYLVALMDYTELRAAYAVSMMPLAALVVAPFVGRALDRVGPRYPAAAGAAISAVGLFALGHLTRNATLTDAMWRTGLVGIGLGLSVPSLMAAGMTALPEHSKGAGSGVLNTSRQLGFVLGVAILIAVFGVQMQGAMKSAAEVARADTAAAPFLSDANRNLIYDAIARVEHVDATANMEKIREVAHPLADVLAASNPGLLEGLSLATLSDKIEKLYLDKVGGAFRGPFYAAAIAALLAIVPGFMLGRRLTNLEEEGAS